MTYMYTVHLKEVQFYFQHNFSPLKMVLYSQRCFVEISI